ncbi:hypothetical protein QQX10_10705 [Demequina sp. SYSU T00039]|uniref:AAA ATPase domain-containing protein n=1 Tax=Demequina lignilytica TaxID=3051663 RepID=A0AAW7M4D4_9MICO|nr:MULTISPECIES: hypothetical protein [unclassified Demequina]MDN4478659.1 hypothetical protein [Demequina sp. SYSU T00039-1]MDN4488637.1 hypothetical protein [Demequina sp. SYSU T00039]
MPIAELASEMANNVNPSALTALGRVWSPKTVKRLRESIGLPSGGQFDAKVVAPFLKHLQTPGGSMQTRALDALASAHPVNAAQVPEHVATALLQCDASEIDLETEVPRVVLEGLVALCLDEDPLGDLVLLQAAHSGESRGALALALLADTVPAAREAYGSLASAYPSLPEAPPTRADVRALLEGAADGSSVSARVVESDTSPAQPSANSVVEFEPGHMHADRELADTLGLEELEELIGKRWDGAIEDSAGVAAALAEGTMPSTDELERLHGFLDALGAAADEYGARGRDELRDVLEDLRRDFIDPARAWLRRLVEMTGPDELASDIDAVAAKADEASRMPQHDSDAGLEALLTLIDLVSEPAEGASGGLGATFEAQTLAAEGLPDHPVLVMAAGRGLITVPRLDVGMNGDEDSPDDAKEPTAAEASGTARVENSETSGTEQSATDALEDSQSGDRAARAEATEQDDDAASDDGTNSEGPPDSSLDATGQGIELGSTEVVADEPGDDNAASVGNVSRGSGGLAAEVASDAVESPEYAGVAREDPWQGESPSDIACLVRDGRELLAYMVAERTGTATERVAALRAFAAAWNCKPGRLATDLADIWPDADAVATLSGGDLRLLLAASTRLALSLGYDPTGQIGSLSSSISFEGYPQARALEEIIQFAARNFERPTVKPDAAPASDHWTSLATSARETLAAIANSKINYQRASKIMHFLARNNEAIGTHLNLLAETAENEAAGVAVPRETWDRLREGARQFSGKDARARLIAYADEHVSVRTQLRQEVEAGARQRMLSYFDDVEALSEQVSELRAETIAAVRAGRNDAGASEFFAACDSLTEFEVRSVGDAAIARLIQWLREDGVASAETFAAALAQEMAPLFEVERDERGNLARDPEMHELDALRSPRDPMEVARGYLERGNGEAAEQWIDRQGIERSEELEDLLRDSAALSAKRFRIRYSETARLVARVQALGVDSKGEPKGRDAVVGATAQLAGASTVHDERRYDLALQALDDVAQSAMSLLDGVQTNLRERAHRVVDETDRTRILRLIDSGDEPLAVEYLTFAEDGEPLPVADSFESDDFAEFFPDVVEAAEAKRGDRSSSIERARVHLGAVTTPTHERLGAGLRAWGDLEREKQGRRFKENLTSVLRMLGLVPDASGWFREQGRSRRADFASFVVGASPIDGSYVPLFGSKAHGRFDLTLVWDDVHDPQKLLQYVDTDRQNEPNIILYFGVLSVDQRTQLRRLTTRRGTSFSPMIIDAAVIAWLSTRSEPTWKATQRVTLPFTTINPYAPFAGGEVPDEVFVGRERERKEIIDASGSMFVYGGRQLGKSALLRKVERGLNGQRDGNGSTSAGRTTAVYLDLKAANIGEAQRASALWPELAQRLIKADVLSAQRQKWTADNVVAGIERWLESDPSRRLLLLLDEADNFLTEDASETASGGLGGFPVLQRLKGLMENSHRRFKPVFAGLHQVQRFHDMPNTPVAHGGRDTLIGPLTPSEAQNLVNDPLRALGYEFASSETIWRLLLLTNYQASLIQIACEALVNHMSERGLTKGGGRIQITTQDVEDVYAKPEVREGIRERFHWTINLDNRYRVIALVTAVLSFEADAGTAFSPRDLHLACADYWPQGFAQGAISSAEFRRYLDEMKGLGVLHRRETGDYVLRSPNIRSLLGTRQQIEEELLEVAEGLEVAPTYNPALNRRIIRPRESSGGDVRSPLADADLARLLDRTDPIQFVIGTEALGIARVAQTLLETAEQRSTPSTRVTPQHLSQRLRSDLERHIILDLLDSHLSTEACQQAIRKLSNTPGADATVIAAIDGPVDVNAYGERFPTIRLARWTTDGLRTIQDSGFSTQGEREALRQATGGWPELVEKALGLVAGGQARDAALEEAIEVVRDPELARHFLQSTGVRPEWILPWVKEFGESTSRGLMALPPLTPELLDLIDDSDHPAVEVIEHLELVDAVEWVDNGVLVDAHVVTAAAQLLR